MEKYLLQKCSFQVTKLGCLCVCSVSLMLVKQGSVSHMKCWCSVAGLRPLMLFKKAKLVLLLCGFISTIEA